ncbi:glycosyltransferase family 4 protein [Vibrio sp. Of7-15]|uniref:glycosyltransferase family 4 protein n=1 Tax=Vibrio sp. Of7-15 TaxID=2724879 RepID=UPI001EF1FB15|nr:glycosyltransferase family 4 protein [Vibrio sp. Of7-15]MCG7499922.1 glycosyltransferase family 4 protein [Vibrio sp. Of7-15]
MRISILCDTSGFGGIESHLLYLAKLITQNGLECEVVFYQPLPEHPLVSLLEVIDVHCVFLDGHVSSLNRYLSHLPSKSLVHAHGYKASILARVLCLLKPIHCFTTFHAGESGDGLVRFYEWLNKKTAFLSHNFAVSEAIQKTLSANSRLLGNFVFCSPNYLSRTRHTRLQIAFVGRFCRDKGFDRFCQLAKQDFDIDWHIFGSGELTPHIPSQENITVHGCVKSMEEHWKDIDLLLMPSRAEGLPLAALEAMSFGVPVLATKVGQLEYLLPKALLVEGNKWQELGKVIEHFQSQPAQYWLRYSYDMWRIIAYRYSHTCRWPQLKRYYGLAFCEAD